MRPEGNDQEVRTLLAVEGHGYDTYSHVIEGMYGGLAAAMEETL